jgi:hypothetical protein
MAKNKNNNKKISDLVKTGEPGALPDPTIIPTLTQRVFAPVRLLETDEDTYDVDRANRDASAITNQELTDILQQREKRIEKLEFECEQALIRRRGLEKELEVREEIAENIINELRVAKRQIRESRKQAQLAEVSQQLQEKQARIETLTTELEDLTRENLQLRESLKRDVDAEIESFQNRIAEQDGELAARAHEISRLRKDNTRFEEYGNSLRVQLQDQMSAKKLLSTSCKQLEARLESSTQEKALLRDDLDELKKENLELTKSLQAQRNDFERELRQVRFELGAAQETLADQESINQQLASDLIDTRSFRLALESHVGQLEKDNEETIRELKKRLKIAQQEADEYDEKLRTKDAAISDLMKELAIRSRRGEPVDDIDKTLKKIEGFKPGGDARLAQSVARNKSACLLIDNSDGRELRFPLFKNRLTIGRTSHNDIQLDMRFVSRRHAVISNDCGKTRVIDWGSKNGVFVNDVRVAEKILAPGDVVTIGTTKMRYEERPRR